MFDNARYLTRGIQSSVPLDTQIIIWELIKELNCRVKLDYLQVFRLQSINENGQTLQSIEHHQEVPEYIQKRFFRVSEVINATIFVIDDEDHSTMLLSEEY